MILDFKSFCLGVLACIGSFLLGCVVGRLWRLMKTFGEKIKPDKTSRKAFEITKNVKTKIDD